MSDFKFVPSIFQDLCNFGCPNDDRDDMIDGHIPCCDAVEAAQIAQRKLEQWIQNRNANEIRRREVSRKLGGIVCDHCKKFIAYGDADRIKEVVVANEYCGWYCHDKAAKEREKEKSE